MKPSVSMTPKNEWELAGALSSRPPKSFAEFDGNICVEPHSGISCATGEWPPFSVPFNRVRSRYVRICTCAVLLTRIHRRLSTWPAADMPKYVDLIVRLIGQLRVDLLRRLPRHDLHEWWPAIRAWNFCIFKRQNRPGNRCVFEESGKTQEEMTCVSSAVAPKSSSQWLARNHFCTALRGSQPDSLDHIPAWVGLIPQSSVQRPVSLRRFLAKTS